MSSDRDRREADHRVKIRQALNDNKLVIVVGAGVSLSATHPSPSRITWTGLIRNGLDYLEEERFVPPGDEELEFYRNNLKREPLDYRQLLRACSYLTEELNRHHQYATWLDIVFGSLHQDVKQPAILHLIGQAHRNGAKVLTTNYDELLEHFCNLQRVRRSIPDDVRKYERGTLKGIFHIHGSYQDPEDVVLDAIGYYKVQQSDDVQSLMKSYLAHHTILFVGCGSGLEDPNFDALLSWASERAKNIANHHYLLARTTDDMRHDPLITLRYGPEYGDLVPYLASALGMPSNDLTDSAGLDFSSPQAISAVSRPAQSPKRSGSQIEHRPKILPRIKEVVDVEDETSAHPFLELQHALERLNPADAEPDIRLPIEGTCEWIFDAAVYRQWSNALYELTLLCITGRLGSGKSTLIKHVASTLQDQAEIRVASFFARPVRDNAPGHAPVEIYLSLLLQVIRWPVLHEAILAPIVSRLQKMSPGDDLQEYAQEIRDDLLRLLRNFGAERVLIFLDAIDDCSDVHEISLFLQDVDLSNIPGLRICYSCRQSIPLLRTRSLYLGVEDFNQEDIAAYIRSRLPLGGIISQPHRDLLTRNIERRSSGVFLWVVLAVDLLQRYINKGREIAYLHSALNELPKELTSLYQDIIARAVKLNSAEETQLMVHVLQWVLFSARPLTAAEWHHVLALIENPWLRSIWQWKMSPTYTESDDLLLQRLRSVCCGLVEVQERQLPLEQAMPCSESGSLGPGAGSFESREYVRVIHRSVQDYLLKGNAFTLMDSSILNPVGNGHGHLLNICVRYSFLTEMIGAFRQEDSTHGDRRTGLRPTNEDVDSDDDISLGGSAFESSIDLSYEEDLPVTPDLGDHVRRWRHTRSVLSEAGSEDSADSIMRRLAHASSFRRTAIAEYIRAIGPSGFIEHSWSSAYNENSEGVQSPDDEPIEYLRTLENPPALWQYCRSMLVYHASAADKAGILPEDTLIFLVIHNISAWGSTRWDMRCGATLLYFAARWNLVQWIKFLQIKPSKVPEGGQYSWPAIVAIRHGQLEAFEALVPTVYAIKTLCWPFDDSNGRAALHHAAMAPKKEFLSHVRKVCEQAGMKKIGVIDARDKMGLTALHLAAAHGCAEQIEALLALGASVRCCDDLQNTPLHLACARKDADIGIYQMLVDAGSDIEALNYKNETPDRYARAHANPEIALYLSTLKTYPRTVVQSSGSLTWTRLLTLFEELLPERLKKSTIYEYDTLLVYRIYERVLLLPEPRNQASNSFLTTTKGWTTLLFGCFRRRNPDKEYERIVKFVPLYQGLKDQIYSPYFPSADLQHRAQ